MCNLKNYRCEDARSAAVTISERQWERIEEKFRIWSFHVYYEKTFAHEPDMTLRFVKAILASSQPIRDREAVIAWHCQRQQRYRTKKKTKHVNFASVST